MNCKNCQKTFDIKETGSLDAEECRPCTVSKLIDTNCSNIRRMLCDDWNCKKCFTRSFADDERCIMWNYDLNQNWPIDISKSSKKDYWFTCDKCSHNFKLRMNNLVHSKQWCSYCSNHTICLEKSCTFCSDKSFATHVKAPFFMVDKNGITQREIFKHSGKSYWFKCKNNHEFKMAIRTVTTNNCWCPKCKNKTEKKFMNILSANKIDFVFQPRFPWCKYERELPFDFQIQKWIIEMDGGQHFWDVKKWKTSSDVISNTDVFKMNKAIEQGLSVIRIVQQEVLSDSWDWFSELSKLIIIVPETPQVHYLSKDQNIYAVHKQKMLKEVIK